MPREYDLAALSKGSEREVIGLIPAAGQATRLPPLPCSKELFPVGFRVDDKGNDLLPKVFCHYLMEKIRLAVIVPSEWYENAPISILEALAFGKPVVGSRIGGIPEMIDDGVNGYLFEPGNIDDLREKLELVLSMPHKHISEMGQAARKKVEREYNDQLHYERLMGIYNRVLGQD